MQTLNLATDSFDQDNTFTVQVKGFKSMKRIRVSLHCGYKTNDDGIYWAMKRSAMLKSEYTAKDIEENNRMMEMEAVCDGDIVLIDGKQYKTRVLGDYSNCAVFDPV